MELDDDEKLDAPSPIKEYRPDYPWGLRLCLTEQELEKLDLDSSDAFVGGMVHIFAMARIIGVNVSSSSENGDRCRIELQIENLGIESEDAENEGQDDD